MKKRISLLFLLGSMLFSITGCFTEKDAVEGRWELCTLVKCTTVERLSITGIIREKWLQTWETSHGLTVFVYADMLDEKDTIIGTVQRMLVTR